MIVLNFSHPLTEGQQAQIRELTQTDIERLIQVQPQLDDQAAFGPQVTALFGEIEMTSEEWQQAPILVVPPALNFAAALVLAELHGRMGYFPPVVRIRPIADSMPRRFEVAEILDLQKVREASRRRR